MKSSETPESIFGVFDGLVSVIGVIIGLLAASESTIVAGAIGLAAASAASMGAGEYLADQTRNLRKAEIMALATLIGTLLPILPFIILPKTGAIVLAGFFALMVAGWISHIRSRYESKLRAYIETYAILIVAISITFIVTILTGIGS